MRPPAPTKPRILIVDDEAAVRASLQRMLLERSDDWDLQFLSDGPAALASLSVQPVDVVLSDLKMPGMTGAQLLNEIALGHPNTVRIAFSEPTDQELLFKCVNSVHQFLAKPCDAGSLVAALGRALNVGRLVGNEQLKTMVGRLHTIPSPPDVFHELQRLLASPDASVETMGQTIARDPAMTAKLLKLVNSAFFGLNRKVSSPTDAAIMLGMETIRMLVLCAEVFSSESATRVPGFSLDSLSVHSMCVGRIAKGIVELERGNAKMREMAMTAGLLHDLGKLVIAVNCPDLMVESIDLAQRDDLPFDEAERRVFGTDHSEIGAHLLSLWGLPLELVEVVGFHHRPGLCASETFSALTAVHVADILQRESEPLHGVPSTFDTDYLEVLGIADRIDVWRDELLVNVAEVRR